MSLILRRPGILHAQAQQCILQTGPALAGHGSSRSFDHKDAVVRADENGQFEVAIDSNAVVGVPYQVFIVSKNGVQKDGGRLTKDQFASLAEFFSPVEDLVEKKPFFWMTLTAEGDRVDLPEVEF